MNVDISPKRPPMSHARGAGGIGIGRRRHLGQYAVEPVDHSGLPYCRGVPRVPTGGRALTRAQSAELHRSSRAALTACSHETDVASARGVLALMALPAPVG